MIILQMGKFSMMINTQGWKRICEERPWASELHVDVTVYRESVRHYVTLKTRPRCWGCLVPGSTLRHPSHPCHWQSPLVSRSSPEPKLSPVSPSNMKHEGQSSLNSLWEKVLLGSNRFSFEPWPLNVFLKDIEEVVIWKEFHKLKVT